MKKNFLFKWVSVLGAVLLLATSVMPGLQYAYADPEVPGWDEPADSGYSRDYIYDEASWNAAYNKENSALKAYYDTYSDEDRWHTVDNVLCNGTYRIKDGNDCGESACEKDEYGYDIDANWNHFFPDDCVHSRKWAIGAPDAKYPWVVLNLPKPFAGEIEFIYDEWDDIYPYNDPRLFSKWFGIVSIPGKLWEQFLLDENGKTTFDPSKLAITLIPEAVPVVVDDNDWNYIWNEETWNAAYNWGDSALWDYYIDNPNEDLWNPNANPERPATTNDREYGYVIYSDEAWTIEVWNGTFNKTLWISNTVQKVTDETNNREYFVQLDPKLNQIYQLFTDDTLGTSANLYVKFNSLSYPWCVHNWKWAINLHGTELRNAWNYPWIVVSLPESFEWNIVFNYDNGSKEKSIYKGWKSYSTISIPTNLWRNEFALDTNGNTTFNSEKLEVSLVWAQELTEREELTAIITEAVCDETNQHSILWWTACEDNTQAVACSAPAEPDANATYTQEENITWDAENGWPEEIPTCTIASCAEWFHKNEAWTACVDNENLTITATKLPAASIPNDGNKKESQENQNAVTIVQDDENNIVIYGVLEDLNQYPSTNEQQGEGKWVAIVLTTNLDTIAGAKWWNYTMTADDDVVESASVGLNQNQIIYWVKAEELSTPKETTISADGYNPVTIKVKVEEKYTVTFVDEDGTTVLKEATAYDPQTAAADIVKPADPTKAADNTCNKYKFNGWTQELVDVTAHATYKATYTCTSKKITSSWGGGGGSSSYSCKNLPDNATANNSTKPTKSTDYSYDTDTTKVCTFQCDKGYSWNTKDAKCEKSDAQTNTWDTNTLDETNKDWTTNGGNGGEGSNDGNKNPTTFSQEFIDAYNFAYKNGITTKESIEEAEMFEPLTRIAMAKMLSQYAINVLGQTPDTSIVVPTFPDVDAKLDADYNNWVTLAYQLWIMWIGIQKFRPFDTVTRAEFGTALSRMLYGTADGEWNEWYSTHLQKLMDEKIITNNNPDLKELRGYVMIMLMRSAQ